MRLLHAYFTHGVLHACGLLCVFAAAAALQFVEELGKLQDRVPAFSADKAAAIIEADLGQPVSKLFRSFDRRPIAAASLGQVHRAVLHTGEAVVVKVQRPGLKQLFDIDLNNLRILAEQLDKGDENRDFKVGGGGGGLCGSREAVDRAGELLLQQRSDHRASMAQGRVGCQADSL